jgi:O-antigen/teichoic acid export membrane protein
MTLSTLVKTVAIDTSLKKIAKGGAVFTFGHFIGSALHMVIGVVVIRLISKSEYGYLSLGYTLVNIFMLFSLLGFGNGVPRFIAKYKENENKSNISVIAGSSLLTTVAVSVLLSIIFFTSANFIATQFHKPEIVPVLSVFALMITPLALIQNLTAIFRGLGKIKPRFLFQDLTLNISRLIFLIPLVFCGLAFKWVIVAYVASVWVAFTFFATYALQNLSNNELSFNINWQFAKKLINFSIPLLGLNLIGRIMGWTATLTLGYFQSSDQLGLYSAPLRLTALLPLPLTALIFLYLPVATGLFEKGKIEDLKKLYISITKWAFFLTLPFLFLFLFAPDFVLSSLFGQKYLESANVLRILSIGFSIQTFFGPNGSTLIAAGKSKEVFGSTMLGALVTIVICVLLVPGLGALGAAIGTTIALLVSNIFRSLFLFAKYGIHPISKYFIKPMVLSIFILSISYSLLKFVYNQHHISIYLSIFVVSFFITLFSPFLTRSLQNEDFATLKAFENQISHKTNFTDKLNSWFHNT